MSTPTSPCLLLLRRHACGTSGPRGPSVTYAHSNFLRVLCWLFSNGDNFLQLSGGLSYAYAFLPLSSHLVFMHVHTRCASELRHLFCHDNGQRLWGLLPLAFDLAPDASLLIRSEISNISILFRQRNNSRSEQFLPGLY